MTRWMTFLTIMILCAACSAPPDINRTRIAATAAFATNTPPPQVGEVTPTLETTPTPFVYPVSIPPTAVCPETPRSRLIIHERGRVLDDDPRALRMRSGPGTNNGIITQIPVNSVFMVLEGPVCAEQYAWWRIRFRDQEGWIAEGEPAFYYVEPYLPG